LERQQQPLPQGFTKAGSLEDRAEEHEQELSAGGLPSDELFRSAMLNIRPFRKQEGQELVDLMTVHRTDMMETRPVSAGINQKPNNMWFGSTRHVHPGTESFPMLKEPDSKFYEDSLQMTCMRFSREQEASHARYR
jgi:hypothetical protein